MKMQKLHLLSSIAILQRYSAVADNEELQGQLLSLLPARLMLYATGVQEPMSPLSGASTGSVEVAGGTNVAMASFGVDWVKQITTWYHNLIFLGQLPPSSASSPSSPSSSPTASSSASSASLLSVSPLTSLCSLGHLPQFFTCLATQLASVLSRRRTHSAHAKLLLFLALLRSLHINVRLVHVIEQTAYPWEQQGWMDDLRRMAVTTRGKADVGRVKEMRIGGRLVQVMNKRDNLRRMWRVALPRTVADGGGGCECGGNVEWRYVGLAGTVVPPVRSVSLIGRQVSLTRAGSTDVDEVVIDSEDEETERDEQKQRMSAKEKKGTAKLGAVSRNDEAEEEEDRPLASKLLKKERTVTDVKPAQRQRTQSSQHVNSSAAIPPTAAVKAEQDNGAEGSTTAKSKRKQRVVSEADDEEEMDDASIYVASIRQRKARAGKPIKDETGKRRSERVKQQAEADVIVLSSDDEDAVSRIKQQAEEREREELRRLQDEEDERMDGEEEEEEQLENMVRSTRERAESDRRETKNKKHRKAVKRRLMSEENLVSSEDSDADVYLASKSADSDRADSAKLTAASTNGRHGPGRLFTLEEENELDNIPLVPASVDNAARSISLAVDAMMHEAKQADSAIEHTHVSATDADINTEQPKATAITATSAAAGKCGEELKDGDESNVQQTSCYVCGSHRPTASNPILLCDGCERECHIKCVTPPLSKVPTGNWYCRHCREEKKEDSSASPLKERQDNDDHGDVGEEDEDEDEDEFVPKKKKEKKKSTKSTAGPDSQRRRKSKKEKVETTDGASQSQPSHLFDRYQFGSHSQNGKEEKVEEEEEEKDEKAAVDDEYGPDADDNSSVMEDITPRKQQKLIRSRKVKRQLSTSSSPSSSTSSSPSSRPRRSSTATSSPVTSSSPTASSKSKSRTAATDPTGLYLPFWVELYCPSQECWIHVDPINNLVDVPHTYESLKPRRTFSYVLAAYPPVGALQRALSGGYGFASASTTALPYMSGLSRVVLDDVTARYGVGSAMLPRGRLDEQWWQSTLESLSAPHTSAYDRRIHEAEQASFSASRSTSLAELPTTLATLKKHPLYISLDQVKKFEALRPGAPIAARTTVGKQSVALYWRKDVHLLHTVERWVREKRQVREDQLAKPSKLVKSQTMAGRKKRKILQYARAMHGDFDRLSLDAAVQDIATSSSASASSSTLPDDDELSALYGIWQTDPWAPPVSKDGVVPRNARGQVDLWTPAHLPLGCVHLPYPRIAAIARKLGVDYAEAMVGFEVRGGRSIPKFEGIVVIQHNAEWVLDAYREKERETKEKEDKKRWERVSFNWRRLVKGAVVRAKLMAELKERNESGEGKEEEQHSTKSGKGARGGKRGKKGQAGEEEEAGEDEQQAEVGKKAGKRRAVPKGSGDAEVVNDLNHVHDFTSSKTMNRETGSWIATCRCGARNEFEDL